MADIMNSIREVIRLSPFIKEKRKELRELETQQNIHRDLLKEHYGNNTVIRTSAGDITIREKTQDGKLSLEDIHTLFDTIDWLGDDTKTRLLKQIDDLCGSMRKYSKTLTVRKSKRKRNKTIKKERNDLKQDT
jgi:hypothetical protein